MSRERETSSTSTNIDLYVPTQTERKISSADFPSLLLTERETGRVTTAERETVVGERVVTHRTRLVVDEDTGQETFETVQLVEKTIEHEVQFSTTNDFCLLRSVLHKEFSVRTLGTVIFAPHFNALL